jgi:gliding motility-associated-like protein
LPIGTYCVIVTDANGCPAASCVTITQPAELIPVPDIERTICYGDSTQIWANALGGTAPYQIDWIDGIFPQNEVGPIIVDSLFTADYCYTVTDANGCFSDVGCVTITVLPALALDLTPSLSICDGDSIDLFAQATGGDGVNYQFEWHEDTYPGTIFHTDAVGNTSEVTVGPTTATFYYVELSDGCSVDVVEAVEVSINATPILFVNIPEPTGCAPYTASFFGSTDIGVTFDWDFDCDGIVDLSGTEANPSWTYAIPGIYDVCVTVSSADVCSATDTTLAAIEVFDVPTADFVFTPDETTILNPTIYFTNTSTGEVEYNWDFGDGSFLAGIDTIYDWNSEGDSFTIANPVHTFIDTGVFVVTLTVFNANGCSDVVSYTIHIQGDYIIHAPNAFTPNGDGVNDVWIPQGVGIGDNNYELYIFNRWGQLIFESYDKNTGWDGTTRGTGKLAKLEVYVWMIRTIDHNSESHEYIGHVTVVR